MKTLRTILLIAVLTFGVQFYLSAQTPPTPPSKANQGGGAVGQGAAPVGCGLVVLLSLAGVYGGYKLYKNANQDEEEN
ncbi:MAG: hypothetical protein ACOXZ9_02910 [Bacteroidales bacterium]|jgi:uncharacterized membrane protein